MTKYAKTLLAAVSLTGLALLTTLGAAYADEFDALRQDERVENGVLIIAIGDLIQDNCPTFEDRRARSLIFLQSLVSRARDLGYDNEQIERYVDDDAEKDRVRARATQWFDQQGASTNQPESICQVARQQIAEDTAIGRLLRER